jgi:hypothetical protein
MSSKRWSSSDKLNLIKQYASGSSLDEIGKNLNRSPNAIKLRLESIVYENLTNNKSTKLLQKMLNTDDDTIKQLYYSHKSFLQGRGKDVIDVKFDDTYMESAVDKMLSTDNNKLNDRGDILKPRSIQQRSKKSEHYESSSNEKNDKLAKTSKNLKRIQEENKVLDEIVKNYTLRNQIKQLYIDKKLDERTLAIYESLFRH